jgi:hypothetical protein
LSVPFAQRFFELAKTGDASSGRRYGLVGQITANSFMKREFGTRLIETYFRHEVELREVIDSSGAHITGHSTPTVILVGTNRGGKHRTSLIRTVRGIQGEPSTPDNGEDGVVWQAIIDQIDRPGSSSPWVSVEDLDRDRYFGHQPWILADGGREMFEHLRGVSREKLGSLSESVGRTTNSGADDAYMIADWATARRLSLTSHFRDLVVGEKVRDYSIAECAKIANPYADLTNKEPVDPQHPIASKFLWPARTVLRNRIIFGKPITERHPWFVHLENYAHKLTTPLSITFAEVATHNHFTLDRGGKVFKQTAPVIKFPKSTTEEKHQAIVGVLNSSTVALWLKLVCFCKGNATASSGMADQPWSWNYQFNGANIERVPLPASYPGALAQELDSLATRVRKSEPSSIIAERVPTRLALQQAKKVWLATRGRMIALQEELDWQVYSLYNLHSEDLRVSEDPDSPDIPELALGERAFEIVLARRAVAGEASDEWFKRHGSTPITEIPAHWHAAYREVVQKRIDAIESSRAIGMIERPEYKRRWATEGWDALQEKALKSWLLDRIEDRSNWFDENGMPALVTLSRLTDNLSRDEDFPSVAKIYAPHKELPAVVAELMTTEHVPFLAALRYKPSGLKKRADWEHVWDLQRQEDAAPDEPAKRKIRDTIPVPPKYTSADFLRPSYWRARGKLDVPKERFISYGRTNTATPTLYGWGGWDHCEQAIALDTYIATHEGLTTEEVTPLLAGLLELQPWLDQWHNEPDPLFAPTPAKFFEGDRQLEQGKHGLTDDELRAWRPAKK